MRRGFRFSAFRLGRRVAPRGAWAPLGLASAVAGATWERRCRCDDEKWWTDPAQCSDACALWQRTWNGDWDGRGPPPGEKMKATGKIRHLMLGDIRKQLVLLSPVFSPGTGIVWRDV